MRGVILQLYVGVLLVRLHVLVIVVTIVSLRQPVGILVAVQLPIIVLQPMHVLALVGRSVIARVHHHVPLHNDRNTNTCIATD